ncbi:MAG: CDP-diacylglycerol--serine O-phosphatidyltransferase [Chrysiogenetes bacterium]|nr:CDP-diacylglycerol--serine O-phosphatidyltransferase [Chrysiogenetes bacterium]
MAGESSLSRIKARRAKARENARRRGIYVLPALLTTASMFSGFYAIIASIDLRFWEAAWAIVIAGIFDGLDGRVARMTNTTSEFGVQYDSLSDLISFGVAPAILAYNWSLFPYQRWGWVGAFLYVVCAAIRLGRFNIQQEEGEGKDYFMGLASPAAAGLVITPVLLHQQHLEFFDRFGINGIEGTLRHPAYMVLVYVAGLLMVSEIPFKSPKEINFVDRSRFRVLVFFVLLLALLAIQPVWFFFGTIYLYVLGGLLMWMISAGRRPDEDDDDLVGGDDLPEME